MEIDKYQESHLKFLRRQSKWRFGKLPITAEQCARLGDLYAHQRVGQKAFSAKEMQFLIQVLDQVGQHQLTAYGLPYDPTEELIARLNRIPLSADDRYRLNAILKRLALNIRNFSVTELVFLMTRIEALGAKDPNDFKLQNLSIERVPDPNYIFSSRAPSEASGEKT